MKISTIASQSREGRTVAEIFRIPEKPNFGVPNMRPCSMCLQELRGGGARIVALGGGAFVQKENAALLKAFSAPTVFLDAPVEELWQRCCTQASETGAERPLLRSVEQFRKLYETRRNSYSEGVAEDSNRQAHRGIDRSRDCTKRWA